MAGLLPWLKHFYLDWWKSPDVLRMSPAERDAYRWLLDYQFEHEHLPYASAELVALMPRTMDHEAADRVLVAKFPPDPDTNQRRNGRMQEVREQAYWEQASLAQSGSKGGKTKAKRHKEMLARLQPGYSSATAKPQPGHSQAIARPQPGHSNQNQNQNQIVPIPTNKSSSHGARATRAQPKSPPRGASTPTPIADILPHVEPKS